MSSLARVPTPLKRVVRRVLRYAGYDIRPLCFYFDALQRELLRSCDLLVDVGANTGQYVRLVRQLGYAGPVVSFEPEAAAFEGLRREASKGFCWQVRRIALADREGEACLRVSANSVSSSLLDIREEHLAAAPSLRTVALQPVTVSTLDTQLAAEPGAALWLKLDVQGSELAVLHGGTATLARTLVVQTEVSLRPLYERQTDYLELFAHLRGTGFTMCHVLPGFQDSQTGHLLQFDALFVRLAAPPGGTDLTRPAQRLLAGPAGAG